MVQPLKNGLLDITPYVRKTAAISCAKLYQVAPSVVSGADSVSHQLTIFVKVILFCTPPLRPWNYQQTL